MRITSSVALDPGRRVQRFLDTNSVGLAAVNAARGRQTLDDAVAALETHANELESKSQQSVAETARQRALRVTLLKLLRSIHRVGQLSLAQVPDFSPLRLPTMKARRNVLLEQAYALYQAAEPHAQVFVDGGLPADFLAQLAAAITGILTSVGDRSQAESARVLATGATVTRAAEVRAAIRALDALVHLALPTGDELLVAWASARRFRAIRSTTVPAAPTADMPSAPPNPQPGTEAPSAAA